MSRKVEPVDAALLAFAALVWAALAVVYWLTPSLAMPGYIRVWGAGAVLLAALAVAVYLSRGR